MDKEQNMDLLAAEWIRKCTEGFVKPKPEYRTVVVAYQNNRGQPKLKWVSKNKSLF